MKSLFIRIFLWFWLAMTLVVAAFAISVIGTSLPPPNPEELVSHMLETVGQTSLEMLPRQGPAEVRNFVRRVSSPGETRLSVFSTEHPELSANRAPDHVRGLIEEAKKDDALHHLKGRHEFVYAKRVRSDEAALVVVFEAPQFQAFLEAAGDPRALGLRIVAVVLVGGLVCYWLARSITAPLQRLSAATSQLSKGDLSVRVGPKLVRRGDELAELAKDFDRMAGEIDTLVTAQRRLLQDVSHELRSPLGRLNVALALARQKSPADATDALDRIECEAERLNRLIGQLLTLARFDSRPDELRKEVDVEALIETIVQDAQFEADSRRVSVQIVKSQACSVLGHFDLLFAALENVVRNAVRYTDEGTSVEISLESSEGEHGPEVIDGCIANGQSLRADPLEIRASVGSPPFIGYAGVNRIRVRDHGPGVPERELSNILQPFYSVDDGHARHNKGTGLGLSIVDRVVGQLGGSISLSNAADGGLIFDIYLPCAGSTY